jgi:hypothetical protein
LLRVIASAVFYFNESPSNATLLRSNGLNPSSSLGSGSYTNLDPVGLRRQNLDFSINNIMASLPNLIYNPTNSTNQLLLLTQWLSEAARFIPIQTTMTEAILEQANRRPDYHQYLDAGLVAAENDWGTLTARVNQSNNYNGALNPPYNLDGYNLQTGRNVSSFGLGALLGTQFGASP